MSNLYFDEVEAALLKALCFYVKKEFDEDEQNFSSVLKLLECAYENEGKVLDVIMDDLKERKPDHIALEYYNTFKTDCGKRRKGIVVSCTVRLAPFHVITIKNLTNTDTIDLDSIEKEKTALFCIVPPTDTTFHFLVTMLYVQLFEIISSPKNTNNCAYEELFPVRFFVSDFSRIDLVQKLKIGKRDNLAWTIYCHHIASLKNYYPDTWMDVLKNMDVFLFTKDYEKEMLKGIFDDLKDKKSIILNSDETFAYWNEATK